MKFRAYNEVRPTEELELKLFKGVTSVVLPTDQLNIDYRETA